MGTWYSISTSMLTKEQEALFTEHFEENESPSKSFFFAVWKDMSADGAVDMFAHHLGEFANAWRVTEPKPYDEIYISMLCDETDPILVIVRPASFEVVAANLKDRAHIEHYRCYIEGTPEWGVRQAALAKAEQERLAKEARRPRMRLTPLPPKG